MECTSTYIVTQKLDPESMILNRTQVIICSHSVLPLHRHGTCCSRFQRPDAGPRNTIDAVSNCTSESYHLFLESICDESGIWRFAGNWGVEQWLKDITYFQSMLRDVQITRSFGNACSEQSHTSSKWEVRLRSFAYLRERVFCRLSFALGSRALFNLPPPFLPCCRGTLRNTKTGA
jgi:hypothetical protein